MSDTESDTAGKPGTLSREDVTVGTICEYRRNGADAWVIVVREPRPISEYADAIADRSIPEGWEEFRANATDVIHFVPSTATTT